MQQRSLRTSSAILGLLALLGSTGCAAVESVGAHWQPLHWNGVSADLSAATVGHVEPASLRDAEFEVAYSRARARDGGHGCMARSLTEVMVGVTSLIDPN